jgi:hypothetical protein
MLTHRTWCAGRAAIFTVIHLTQICAIGRIRMTPSLLDAESTTRKSAKGMAGEKPCLVAGTA